MFYVTILVADFTAFGCSTISCECVLKVKSGSLENSFDGNTVE